MKPRRVNHHDTIDTCIATLSKSSNGVFSIRNRKGAFTLEAWDESFIRLKKDLKKREVQIVLYSDFMENLDETVTELVLTDLQRYFKSVAIVCPTFLSFIKLKWRLNKLNRQLKFKSFTSERFAHDWLARVA